MSRAKPYSSRSLPSAIREVRTQRQVRASLEALINRWAHERKLLAMLAADGPAFDNPLVAMRAKEIRDEILARECRLAPDGKPLGIARHS